MGKKGLRYGHLIVNKYFWFEGVPCYVHKDAKAKISLLHGNESDNQRFSKFMRIILNGILSLNIIWKFFWDSLFRYCSARLLYYILYSDWDKSWSIFLGKSHSKSVKTYPGRYFWYKTMHHSPVRTSNGPTHVYCQDSGMLAFVIKTVSVAEN
mgnify:CR=1 FL=1